MNAILHQQFICSGLLEKMKHSLDIQDESFQTYYTSNFLVFHSWEKLLGWRQPPHYGPIRFCKIINCTIYTIFMTYSELCRSADIWTAVCSVRNVWGRLRRCHSRSTGYCKTGQSWRQQPEGPGNSRMGKEPDVYSSTQVSKSRKSIYRWKY